MLALRRSTATLRPIPTSYLCAAVFREYHGDPGPSSSTHRQKRRTVLRDAATTGPKRSAVAVNADKSLLNAILDAPTPSAVRSSTPPRTIGTRPTATSKELEKPLRLPTPLSRPGNDSRYGRGPNRGNGRGQVEKREESPYDTSMKLRRWITKHPKNLTQAQTDEVIAIVTEAKASLVNAPVWNVLLGYMGRMQKFDKMWKLYNDMKKRGIQPTSRTYSSMLNAYAGASHSLEAMDRSPTPRAVEERTISRVTILFEQLHKHLKTKLAAHQTPASSPELDDDLGLASLKEGEVLEEADGGVDKRQESIEDDDEIDLAPINAYLKFLGRHNMFEEMQKIFVSMDTEGPLSPDTVTYTTMFASLYHAHLDQLRSLDQPRHTPPGQNKSITQLESPLGPTARGLWDRCVRQFGKVQSQEKKSSSDKGRRIDNELLIHVLRCFLRGRPEDQRFALNLIHEVWSLPPPGQSNFGPASASAPGAPTDSVPSPNHAVSAASTTAPSSQLNVLPKLEPNLASATVLIQLLHSTDKPHLGTHYTTLFLSIPKVFFAADVRFLQSAMNVYAGAGDVAGVMNLLDSFQVSSGRQGWDVRAWRAAMTGARWAGDFDAALTILRRAVHLPVGVENDDPLTKQRNTTPYQWAPPNGSSEDIRGIKWVRPQPIPIDAGMLSNLLKTAMQKSNKEVKMALNIFEYLGGVKRIVVYPPTGEPLAELDPEEVVHNRDEMKDLENPEMGRIIDLVKTLERATERLGPAASAAGTGPYAKLRDSLREILQVWGGFDSIRGIKSQNRRKAGNVTRTGANTTSGSRRHKEGSPRTAQADSDTFEALSPEPLSFNRRSKSTVNFDRRPRVSPHRGRAFDQQEETSSAASESDAFDAYAELYPARSRSAHRSDVALNTRRDRDSYGGVERDIEGGAQSSRRPAAFASRAGRVHRDRDGDTDGYVPRQAFGSDGGRSSFGEERNSSSRSGGDRGLAKGGFGLGGRGGREGGGGGNNSWSARKTFGLKRD
ncbi:hypothetical protein IAU59_004515 [Kwoniella sp. CBS 9459]